MGIVWVSCVPKKRSRDEAVEFLAGSPLVTAPPSNLTRLYYNGSAAKSQLTTTQYRQLRRLCFRRLDEVIKAKTLQFEIKNSLQYDTITIREILMRKK